MRQPLDVFFCLFRWASCLFGRLADAQGLSKGILSRRNGSRGHLGSLGHLGVTLAGAAAGAHTCSAELCTPPPPRTGENEPKSTKRSLIRASALEAHGAAGAARTLNNPRELELLSLQVSHRFPSARGAACERTDRAGPPRPSRTDAFCYIGETNFRRGSAWRRTGTMFFPCRIRADTSILSKLKYISPSVRDTTGKGGGGGGGGGPALAR